MSIRFEITSVLHEANRIAFEWQDAGGTYHVYKDGEHMYEGTSTNFQDTDLTPGNFYKYTIERHEEGEVKDVLVMQTSAFSVEKNKNYPLQSLVSTIIVAKTQIALSWEHLKGTELYTIYRNGDEITQVESNRFIDRDFPMNEPVTYSIYCERTVAQSDDTFNQAKSFIGKAFSLLYEKTKGKKMTVEGFTLMKTVDAPSMLLTPCSEENPTDRTHQWKFKYKTFLEEAMIENPNVISPNRYFKGDDRGFDAQSEDYRTCVTIALNTAQPDASFTFTKKVGETVAYGLDKTVRERETASDEGITIKRTECGAGEVGFQLEHAVGNPLTTAPEINYEVNAIFRSDGTFDLTGFHDQSPNHEIYLTKGQDTRWTPVHQSRSEGLEFMSGVTAYQHWRYLTIK